MLTIGILQPPEQRRDTENHTSYIQLFYVDVSPTNGDEFIAYGRIPTKGHKFVAYSV